MSVVDISAVVDYLMGDGVAADVLDALVEERALAAPDLVVFEVLAVLRRDVLRAGLSEERAGGAREDLGDLPIELYPSLGLLKGAWALRRNMTVADALFVSLAEHLGERLLTQDVGLAAAIEEHTAVDVTLLGA